MAITRVESTSQHAESAATITLTFNSTPAQVSLKVVGLVHAADPGAYTPPAGWTQVGATVSSTGGGVGEPCWASLWYRANAPDGNDTWSWANSVAANAGVGARYIGIVTSLPLDVSGSNTGNGTALSSGSITTGTAAELLFALAAQAVSGISGITLSAPTNSFSLVVQVGSDSGADHDVAGLLERIVSSTGTYSTGATSDTSANWAMIIAGFKGTAVAGGPPPAGQTATRETHPAEWLE